MTGTEQEAPYAIGGRARATYWDPARGTCLADLEVTVVQLVSERPARWEITLATGPGAVKVATVDRRGRDRNGSVEPVPAKGRFGGECGTEGCDRRSRWISTHEARGRDPLYRCEQCCDRIDEAAHRVSLDRAGRP